VEDQAKDSSGTVRQGTLDKHVEQAPTITSFTREGILEAVAKHIVCDDQSLALAEKQTFRNCLVAMRPRSTKDDLPSTHDVTVFIHNRFVALITKLNNQIRVRHIPLHLCAI
jgi:hypothetical protein